MNPIPSNLCYADFLFRIVRDCHSSNTSKNSDRGILIHKHSSSSLNTKYSPGKFGSCLRCFNPIDGSNHTSIFANSPPTPLLSVWHNVLALPSAPPILFVWLSCKLAPDRLDPLPSNLRSSSVLPISWSLLNLPRIFTIIHCFSVWLMYVATKRVLNIKYIQTRRNLVSTTVIVASLQTTKHLQLQFKYKAQSTRAKQVLQYQINNLHKQVFISLTAL